MEFLRLLPSNPASAVSAVLFGGVLGSLLGPGALAQATRAQHASAALTIPKGWRLGILWRFLWGIGLSKLVSIESINSVLAYSSQNRHSPMPKKHTQIILFTCHQRLNESTGNPQRFGLQTFRFSHFAAMFQPSNMGISSGNCINQRSSKEFIFTLSIYI